jgi:tRNA pseudouridine38-40 synthase
MRILMGIVEYDGTGLSGFQVQPGKLTVQGSLEEAIYRVTHEQVRINGAGRTDAGVHALGQVISFRSETPLGVQQLQRALNGVLPNEIAILKLQEAGERFHARRSARARWYRYSLINRDMHPVLQRQYAHHIKRPLNIPAMDAGAQQLVGWHDFRAFGTGRTTERQVFRAYCHQQEEKVLVDLVANAFLRGMVRSIVGTLVRVGVGQLTPVDVSRILQQGDRALAGPSLPARGLCLMAVYYREAESSEYL